MFHNKREIFSFRKYKAYGLASAVIAAFFLAGGVAHADEVTPATTAEVTQVAPDVATDAPTNESTQPTSVTTPAAKPVEESGVAPETTGRTQRSLRVPPTLTVVNLLTERRPKPILKFMVTLL